MENVLKIIFGTVAAGIGWLSPIHPLLVCAFIFIAIDFVTGIAASRSRSKKSGERWGFQSEKAWATVYKLFFVMAGIVLAWLIDIYILDFLNLRLAKIFTGFVCGVELWSYLENAAEISNHPIFKWLGKYMKKQVWDAIETDLKQTKEKDNDQRTKEQ